MGGSQKPEVRIRGRLGANSFVQPDLDGLKDILTSSF